MSLPLFPIDPLPADLDRKINWGENVVVYDSGEQQASTAFMKPLLIWSIPIKLMTEVKQSSLWSFANDRRGTVRPFLMKDPYEYRVNSVMGVRSGITNAATLFLYDVNSFSVHADTTTIGSLFSSLSGFVKLGTHYNFDQDTGILTVNTKDVTDVWGVRSMQYFRKCKFASQYGDNAKLWNIWTTNLSVVELP